MLFEKKKFKHVWANVQLRAQCLALFLEVNRQLHQVHAPLGLSADISMKM